MACDHRAASTPWGWCPTCGGPYDRRIFCPACHLALENDVANCTRCATGRPADGWRRLPGRFKNYELLMQAGCGTLTAVYLARASQTGALVAVKLAVAGKPPAVAQALKTRFARECGFAQFLGGYKEIVKALEHGSAGAMPFLVLEGVQGSSLEQLLGPIPTDESALNPVRRTKLSPQRTVRMLRRIVGAMGRLHQHKLIHRDIKPSNLFLARADQGQVKLADLGLAWLASSADSPDKLLLSPELVSPRSAPYMAPELVRGDRTLKPCSDIYSVGVVAHEMLTGRLPYQINETLVQGPAPAGLPDLSPQRWGPFAAGWLKAHLVADRVPLVETRPDLPSAFADFLAQCLARDPRDRIQSAGELVMQLALIEQELRRGPRSAVAVPSPAAAGQGSVLDGVVAQLGGAPTPGSVSPVPAAARPPTGPQDPVQQRALRPAPQPAAPATVGSLSKVINLAQDRDRANMEVTQLRSALQQTQTELVTARTELATARAENQKLRDQLLALTTGDRAVVDKLRSTGVLPTHHPAQPAPHSAGRVRTAMGPVATNPFMKTELDADLPEELEQNAARSPTRGYKGTGPVQQVSRDQDSGSLLQTRFQETIPGSSPRPDPGTRPPAERPEQMVDRIIRETGSVSADTARQLQRPRRGAPSRPLPPRPGPQPDGAELDLMKTNLLEGPLETAGAEPTSVVTEDELMLEMKTRAVERPVVRKKKP